MIKKEQICLRGSLSKFKILNENDVSSHYVAWLNDPLVNQFLETKYKDQTYESCIEFVKNMLADECEYLFGIYTIESNLHIGNIKLGRINQNHKNGQLSLFIGNTNYWGKGIGLEAIKVITKWGFDFLKLEKIEAGCYESNLSSLKAFLKANYQVEGFFRKHVSFKNNRQGSFWLGILPSECN